MTWTTPPGTGYRQYAASLRDHVLIAGATGSGKSTLLHGLITEIMFSAPNEAELYLIDPKRVELARYKNLPHTAAHVGGFDPEGAAALLAGVLVKMDARYCQMERDGLQTWTGRQIYIIIDEFAALTLSDGRGKPITTALKRIACEGRAAGIHLILATQHPSRKVLDPSIVSNIGTIWALRTNSAIDSRVIMGCNGCETLPRYGQGWMVSPEGRKLYRIPLIPDEEISRLIAWWVDQARPKKQPEKSLLRRLLGA